MISLQAVIVIALTAVAVEVSGSGGSGTGISTGFLGLPGFGLSSRSNSNLGLLGQGSSNLGLPGQGSSNLGLSGQGSSNLGLSGQGSSNLGLPGQGSSNLGLSGQGSSNLGLSGQGSSNLGLSGQGSSNLGLSGQGSSNLGLSRQASSNRGLSGQGQAGSNGGFGITIPGLAGSSLSVKRTGAAASPTFGGSLVIEENGIKIPIQLGQAGGFQAEIVVPILPSITDIIRLAQKALGNFGGVLSALLNQVNNIGLMIVNNIQGFLMAVGMPLQTLMKGAGSLINNAINQGFITAQMANEILISIIQSALSNTLNRFADVVNLLQYAINQKLILEEEALAVLSEAAKQGVHLINNGVDWSLERFLDATAQGQIINNNVANTLKSLLRGNTAADGSFQIGGSGSARLSGNQDNLNIDVSVTDA